MIWFTSWFTWGGFCLHHCLHEGVKTMKMARNEKSTSFRKCFKMRAENGTQTRDPQLGRLVLYRLSYFRKMYCSSHTSRTHYAFSIRNGEA